MPAPLKNSFSCSTSAIRTVVPRARSWTLTKLHKSTRWRREFSHPLTIIRTGGRYLDKPNVGSFLNPCVVAALPSSPVPDLISSDDTDSELSWVLPNRKLEKRPTEESQFIVWLAGSANMQNRNV